MLYITVSLIAIFQLTGCQSNTAKSDGGEWTCTAKNMQNSSYTGGSSAYIHLFGYGRGNNYPVKQVAPNKVEGTTGNGTPFTCTLNK